MNFILTTELISKIIVFIDWNKEIPKKKRDLLDVDEVDEAALHLYNIQTTGTSKFCHYCTIPLGIYPQEIGANHCYNCISH